MSGRRSERTAEQGVGGLVWREAVGVRALDHEDDGAPMALLDRSPQREHMLGSSRGWGVGKESNTPLDEGHRLRFDVAAFRGADQDEVQPAILENHLLGDLVVAAEGGDGPGLDGLAQKPIGKAGVRRDQDSVHLHQGQVEGGLALGALGRRCQEHRVLGTKQLLQAPRVWDVGYDLTAVEPHQGCKSIEPGHEGRAPKGLV